MATGFDAMTGSLLKMNIKGVAGQTLQDKWSAGPEPISASKPGFPNLFMISGPGSPSVLTNMVVSIQQHVNWVCCINHMRLNQMNYVEADQCRCWVEHNNALANFLCFRSNSWYLEHVLVSRVSSCHTLAVFLLTLKSATR